MYGGVKYDTDLIEKLVDGGATGSGLLSSPAGGAGAAFAVLFLAFPFVDLALSAVGDTLTLGNRHRIQDHFGIEFRTTCRGER